MINIGIFQAGYSRLNISKLCRLLNSAGNYYRFKYATKINRLGSPDLPGYAYSDKTFQKLVNPYLANYDIGVVIASVPIEDNFYTRNVGCNLIICTSHEVEEFLSNSFKQPEEYAAIAICEELVSIEFQRVSGNPWTELFHQDLRGCLFDFAGIESQITAKFTSCSICAECEGKLSRYNIHKDVVDFAKCLLSRISRPSIAKALNKCIASPRLSFIYGGIVISTAVNVLASLLISNTQEQLVLLLILVASSLLFPIFVYSWEWMNYIRRT